jgi:diguanylate cyclase (GGDEF)-like protein/PAS domain S-box-containing protein
VYFIGDKMKYIGRIVLVMFSIIVSTFESFYEALTLLSIVEALFFATIAFFVGQLYDNSIYYRKQVELNEERYRNLIELSPEPILVHHNNKIVFANDKLEKLLQSSSEHIIGKSIFDFILPEYNELVKERIEKIDLGDKDLKRMELKITTEQNKILDIEASSAFIVYNNKPSVEVFLTDITERKRIEEEARKTENLYRFITENATDIICSIKPDGAYEYISPSCRQLFDYDPNELIGTSLFGFLHSEEIDTISKLFSEAKHNIHCISLSHRYKIKNGSFIWLETNARTIRNDEGELQGIVAISRDINERIDKESKLLELNEKLEYLSNMDSLTDIPNRRYFEKKYNNEWNRTMRSSMPLSVLMVDIDYFKKFNDYYGHQAGDVCIKQIATVIKETLKRPGDFVARYGGEEFIVLLPETDEIGAISLGESILNNVINLKIENEGSKIEQYITVSIGCSTVIPSKQHNPDDLIKEADKALYLAKESGRNQVKSK